MATIELGKNQRRVFVNREGMPVLADSQIGTIAGRNDRGLPSKIDTVEPLASVGPTT